MRILLLLEQYHSPQTEEMLCAVDFVIVYGKTFEIADEDLNGDNPYKFSEFVSRKSKVKAALRELVLNGYACPTQKNSCIVYSITETGSQFCKGMENEYAKTYSEIAEKAVNIFAGHSEKSINEAINKYSAKSARKE